MAGVCNELTVQNHTDPDPDPDPDRKFWNGDEERCVKAKSDM